MIRIMAEGPQQERLEEIASAIAEVVNSELGKLVSIDLRVKI